MKINKIIINLEYDNGIKEIEIMPNEIKEKDKEIKRLNEIINKYDKELTYVTKQYEFLRHNESKEIKRLNTIIKVVKEFIIENMGYYSDRLKFEEYTERYVKDLNKIINLLNKGE